jgi:hypothetical protein
MLISIIIIVIIIVIASHILASEEKEEIHSKRFQSATIKVEVVAMTLQVSEVKAVVNTSRTLGRCLRHDQRSI